MKMFITALALGVSLMGNAAEAASIWFKADGSDDLGNGVDTSEWKMSLSRFDPSLGNLTSAELYFFIRSENDAFGKETGFVEETGEFLLSSYALAFTSVSVDILGYNSYASDSEFESCDHDFFLGPCKARATAYASFMGGAVVHPEDLELFSGGGTVDVTVSYIGKFSDVTIDVEYIYVPASSPSTNPDPVAPVPLPATGGLLLAASAGLAVMRRRKSVSEDGPSADLCCHNHRMASLTLEIVAIGSRDRACSP